LLDVHVVGNEEVTMHTSTPTIGGTRAAGAGVLVFGLGTFLAVTVGGWPGGSYSAHGVASYLASGHRVAAFVAAYVGYAAAVGLVVFASRMRALLREAGASAGMTDVLWGSAVAGAAAVAVGMTIGGGIQVAYTEATVPLAIAPHVVYLVSELGVLMTFGAGAALVGVALVTLALAARGRDLLPGWLRVLTIVAGVCAALGPFFFPFFLLLAWSGATVPDATLTAAA
jgi:hypothetical protein